MSIWSSLWSWIYSSTIRTIRTGNWVCEIGHSSRYIHSRENKNFYGQLSTGIGLAINFDLVWWKIYTPKYNGNVLEGGL